MPKLKRWDGSAWVDAKPKRWDGSAWVDAKMKYWSGSEWVDIGGNLVHYAFTPNSDNSSLILSVYDENLELIEEKVCGFYPYRNEPAYDPVNNVFWFSGYNSIYKYNVVDNTFEKISVGLQGETYKLFTKTGMLFTFRSEKIHRTDTVNNTYTTAWAYLGSDTFANVWSMAVHSDSNRVYLGGDDWGGRSGIGTNSIDPLTWISDMGTGDNAHVGTDSNGNMYYARRYTSSLGVYIYKYNSSGSAVWGRTMLPYGRVEGLGVDENGDIYIIIESSYNIRKVSGVDGTEIWSVNYPSGLSDVSARCLTVGKKYLYIRATNGDIYALDRESGAHFKSLLGRAHKEYFSDNTGLASEFPESYQ